MSRSCLQPRRAGLIALAAVAVAAAAGDRPAPAADRSGAPCSSAVAKGVLPVWARDGFSDPKPRLPHVLGRSGAIAALVFGYPLQSPPLANRNNKILWVARKQFRFGDLHIRAQRMSGTVRIGRPVERSVAGGPGPSIIDLPAPGCWRLTLAWTHGHDTLDLRYS
jgi:hypothetical protein